VETEPYDVEAQPFAGAHDVDRRYRDFSVPEFWDGYFTAMTESYAKQSDLYVADTLFAPANASTTAVVGGAVPANVSAVLARIVDGALAILDEDLPSFALVDKASYRELLLTRDQDQLAFLNASLGLEEGTIESFRVVPSSPMRRCPVEGPGGRGPPRRSTNCPAPRSGSRAWTWRAAGSTLACSATRRWQSTTRRRSRWSPAPDPGRPAACSTRWGIRPRRLCWCCRPGTAIPWT
jgi:hypothetical protein